MPIYIVYTQGYENCPEFAQIGKAREYLRELVAESYAGAKRKYKTARKHKTGKDSYSITLGSDSRSALWMAHSIVAY